MAYGVTTSGTSRTTSNSVQVATQEDKLGNITATETYGGMETVTEEDFLSGAFANTALNGQTGSVSASVTTRCDHIEVNNEFARTSTETQKPLAAGA